MAMHASHHLPGGWVRERPEFAEPGARPAQPWRLNPAAMFATVALPTATAAVLIPLRESHPAAVALALTVPVVLVASRGVLGIALAAAIAAALAYDVFLTKPYYHVAIHDADDLSAACVLLAVGAIVGVTSSRLARTQRRSVARGTELHELIRFARVIASGVDLATLKQEACERISNVLALEDCRFETSSTESSAVVLLPDGSIMGPVGDLNADRAILPSSLALIVRTGPNEVGRFVMTSSPTRRVSFEERSTAAAIAALFAAHFQPRTTI